MRVGEEGEEESSQVACRGSRVESRGAEVGFGGHRQGRQQGSRAAGQHGRAGQAGAESHSEL
jgi:hypothetical protein